MEFRDLKKQHEVSGQEIDREIKKGCRTVLQENKKVLIYLTGKADATFFYNEIESLIQAFDKVYVITYSDDPDTVKCIENKYNITITIIKMGVKSFFYCPAAVLSFSDSNIREELNYISTKYCGKTKIFCIGYALYYIIFAISVRKRIKQILEENKSCDAYLYSFWMSKAAFSLAMFEYKEYLNVRLVASRAHGYDLYEERNKANYLPFRKLIAQRLDKIFFISDNGKKYFQQYLKDRNLWANELDVIHMGVDNSDYIKSYRTKDEIVIASCSSVNKIKRLDIIIDFMQIMGSKINVRWLHIGDGGLMNEMENLADRKLRNMQVQFLRNVDNKKITGIYKENDVDFFINMSDSEGIPVSIMEALSSGIPVIARNVGGVSEIVNSSNGFLLESLDKNYLEDTADKIVRCFKDKEQYSCLSRNAVDIQREKFSREINNLKLIKGIKGELNKSNV